MADTRPAGEGSERSGEPKVPAQDQPVSELARLIAESDAKGKGFWRRRKRKAASTAPVAVPAAPAAEPMVEKVAEPTPAKTVAPAAVKTATDTATDTATVGSNSPAADKPAGNPEATTAKATDAEATAAEATAAKAIDAEATAATATGEVTAAKVTDDEATPAEATDAEQPATEKATAEEPAAATSVDAPTDQPSTEKPPADTPAVDSTTEQANSEPAAADPTAAAQARSSEGESRPKVGVTYEPDESVEGFPLEYGDIIIGLPKRPEASTDADAATAADSTPEADADTTAAEADADGTTAEADADGAVAENDADQSAEPVSEPTPEAAAEIPAEPTTEAGDEPETAEAPAASADATPEPSEDADTAAESSADQATDADTADESTAEQAADGETADESAAEQAVDVEAAGEVGGVDAADPSEPAAGAETAVQEGGSDAPQPNAGVDADSDVEGSGQSDTDASEADAVASAGSGAEAAADVDATPAVAEADSEPSADDQPAATSDAVSEGAEDAVPEGAEDAVPEGAEDAVSEGAGDAESELAASDDVATTVDVEAEGANADDADDAAAVGTTAIASFAAASSTADDDADSGTKSDAEGNSSDELDTGADNAGSAEGDSESTGDGADAASDADDADAASDDAASGASVGGVREKSVEEVASEQAAMALITALMKLRGALAGSRLPIDVVGADEARQQQRSMLDQLDDYILPRLVQLEAPVLAVVGGSTGAGKSTLVNSLIGQVVSEPGVLRPTTRSPVLIHHPADAEWFTGDRVLPGMARSSGDRPGGMEDPGQIRLVAADTIPQGLAILDAPDIDSVVEANRDLATQLLAAADLWLFVTTAARYADAVPWEFLQSASDRSTAVAVVLDRAPADTIDDITGHLAQMLLERGLGDSPLFSIKETVVDGNGMLAGEVVASIKDWLIDLAADAEARSAVVRRTLQGAVTAMTKKTPAFAKAVRAQADTVVELRSTAETAYERAVKDIAKATQDGTMLRGEVLARWQEFVGTGELLKGLQTNVGRLRDKVFTAVVGKPPPTRDLKDAVESGMESLLREHAEAAAERAEESWQSTAPGRQLLAVGDRDMGRMSKEFPAEAGRAVREWQGYVLELVRKEGADKRSTARILAYGVNGLGLALMVVIFASTAGIPTGAEVGVGAGTAVVGQKLLEAVFGDQAVRSLAAKARDDLDARVHALMDAEFARYLAVLDQHPVDPDAPRQLTEAARAVEDCT